MKIELVPHDVFLRHESEWLSLKNAPASKASAVNDNAGTKRVAANEDSAPVLSCRVQN